MEEMTCCECGISIEDASLICANTAFDAHDCTCGGCELYCVSCFDADAEDDDDED